MAPKRTRQASAAAAAAAAAEEAAPKEVAKPAAAPKKAKKAEAGEKKDGKLTVGDTCPDFEVRTHDDEALTKADLLKKGGAIIFVYPKANTPGCTKQAQGFRDHYDECKQAGYEVYGMSADTPKAQTNWKTKLELQYTLLCDKDKTALNALGFIEKDKIKRSHLILSASGIIEQYCPGVTPAKSVEAATEYCTAKKAGAGEKVDELETPATAEGADAEQNGEAEAVKA